MMLPWKLRLLDSILIWSRVATEVAGFRNVLDEFGKSLYTGSVDPEEYLPKLLDKLNATGVDKVIEEMQSQIDEWKASK